MTKLRMITAGSCVVLLAIATGCQKANPLVGKWQMTQTVMGTSMTSTREFKADGTETMSSGGAVSMQVGLQYKTDGNNLNETLETMTIAGHTVNIDPTKLAPGTQTSLVETFSVDGDKLSIGRTMNGMTVNQTYDRVQQ